MGVVYGWMDGWMDGWFVIKKKLMKAIAKIFNSFQIIKLTQVNTNCSSVNTS